MTITPDEMKALTEQAQRVKRALDGEPLENIYGESYQDYTIAKADEDMIDFARQCAAIFTNPARLEWAKAVRELYEALRHCLEHLRYIRDHGPGLIAEGNDAVDKGLAAIAKAADHFPGISNMVLRSTK